MYIYALYRMQLVRTMQHLSVCRGNMVTSQYNLEPCNTTMWAYTLSTYKRSSSVSGQWVSDGIRTIQTGDNSVRCESTHLTSFSVLVDFTGNTTVRTLI